MHRSNPAISFVSKNPILIEIMTWVGGWDVVGKAVGVMPIMAAEAIYGHHELIPPGPRRENALNNIDKELFNV